MQAHKCRAVLPENHRLVLDLPREIPTGAVEIIVLSSPGEAISAREALPEDWRSTPLPDEEIAVLEAFPAFREAHPLRYPSATGYSPRRNRLKCGQHVS